MKLKEDPRFCPVMNGLCPQGEEKARECRVRFETDFDPVRNIRDFDILCCSHYRAAEVENGTPVV